MSEHEGPVPSPLGLAPQTVSEMVDRLWQLSVVGPSTASFGESNGSQTFFDKTFEQSISIENYIKNHGKETIQNGVDGALSFLLLGLWDALTEAWDEASTDGHPLIVWRAVPELFADFTNRRLRLFARFTVIHHKMLPKLDA